MGRLVYGVEIPGQRKHTKLSAIVDEFWNSGQDVAEYVWAEGEYAQPTSARATLGKACERSHKNVKCVQYGKRVYLIKGEAK